MNCPDCSTFRRAHITYTIAAPGKWVDSPYTDASETATVALNCFPDPVTGEFNDVSARVALWSWWLVTVEKPEITIHKVEWL